MTSLSMAREVEGERDALLSANRNLQAQRDRLRAELERLDLAGGLGLKTHQRIRTVLANRDGQQS